MSRIISRTFKNQRGSGFPGIELNIVIFLFLIFLGVFFAGLEKHGFWRSFLAGFIVIAVLVGGFFLLVTGFWLIGKIYLMLKGASNPPNPENKESNENQPDQKP
jgi:hypothetical protein